jgi:hypothetical protein
MYLPHQIAATKGGDKAGSVAAEYMKQDAVLCTLAEDDAS